MTGRVVRAGLLYFALTFGAGFVLGPLRILVLVPRVGERAAELMELPVMVGLSWLAARWVTRRLAVPSSTGARVGMGVLADPKVAAKLSLTDEQKKKVEAQSEAAGARIRELFQGGNREGAREKMEQMRKESDEKYLAVLTADLKAHFEKMKGETFQMPEGAFGFGGRQGRGGRCRGDRRFGLEFPHHRRGAGGAASS